MMELYNRSRERTAPQEEEPRRKRLQFEAEAKRLVTLCEQNGILGELPLVALLEEQGVLTTEIKSFLDAHTSLRMATADDLRDQARSLATEKGRVSLHNFRKFIMSLYELAMRTGTVSDLRFVTKNGGLVQDRINALQEMIEDGAELPSTPTPRGHSQRRAA